MFKNNIKVRWEDYDSDEDSWEPPRNIGFTEIYELYTKKYGLNDVLLNEDELKALKVNDKIDFCCEENGKFMNAIIIEKNDTNIEIKCVNSNIIDEADYIDEPTRFAKYNTFSNKLKLNNLDIKYHDISHWSDNEIKNECKNIGIQFNAEKSELIRRILAKINQYNL